MLEDRLSSRDDSHRVLHLPPDPPLEELLLVSLYYGTTRNCYPTYYQRLLELDSLHGYLAPVVADITSFFSIYHFELSIS
jgi:hypothetical protein